MSGDLSRNKGKLFEHQVARFLEERGWKATLGRHFDGCIALRKHDCDIFIERRSVGWTIVLVACFLLVGAGLASLFQAELPVEIQGFPIWVAAPPGFLLCLIATKLSTRYAWIECKDLQQSVKRDLIMKLKDQFRDAIKARGVWECWLVSTSRFDEDAIAHAKAHKVTCYLVVEAGGRNMALHRVDSKTGDV